MGWGGQNLKEVIAMSVKRVGQNILKLEGYGLYVTLIDGKLWECPIVPQTSGPTLGKDRCFEWTECLDPPNQRFLNIVNAELGASFTMYGFDKRMTVREIISFGRAKKEAKANAV